LTRDYQACLSVILRYFIKAQQNPPILRLCLVHTDPAGSSADGDVFFDICTTCLRTLKLPIKLEGYDSKCTVLPDVTKWPLSEWPLPPKFAIANHFFTGGLPDKLLGATWPKLLVCSLVTVVAQTWVMHGGQHCSIRSHLILFDAVPGPPATLLPIKLNRDLLYRIVLAGYFTDNQIVRICKLHAIRHRVVVDILTFYKTYNPLYVAVKLDEDLIGSLPQDVDDYVPDGSFEDGHWVACSKVEAIRHYCLLSSRRFAQDKYYMMTNFDCLSLERGYTNAAMITCRARPSMHGAVATVTSPQLRQGLKNRLR